MTHLSSVPLGVAIVGRSSLMAMRQSAVPAGRSAAVRRRAARRQVTNAVIDAAESGTRAGVPE
jgi:hypothetical protein